MKGLIKIALAFWFVTLTLPIVAQTTGKLSRIATSSIRSTHDKYGSERKVSQRLLARSPIDLYLSKIAIKYQGKTNEDMRSLVSGVMLWGVDGKKDKSALSDFSIILTWNDKFEAEIPVNNDELQIGKAKVSDKIIPEVAK